MAKLSKDTTLWEGPSESSGSFGTLPVGTILTLTGEEEAGFAEVEVELEDGRVTGWVIDGAVDRSHDEAPEKLKPKSKVRALPRKKIVVSRDEGILLRRQESFFYGLQGNFALSFIDAEAMTATHSGVGFGGGGHAGIYLSPNVSGRLELGFSMLQGTDPDATVISVNLFDVAAVMSYHFDMWEVFGGLQYSFGAGINDAPPELNVVESASEFSSVWFLAGGGYRVTIGEMTALVFRLKYASSLSRSPIGFQSISGGAYLEIRG